MEERACFRGFDFTNAFDAVQISKSGKQCMLAYYRMHKGCDFNRIEHKEQSVACCWRVNG